MCVIIKCNSYYCTEFSSSLLFRLILGENALDVGMGTPCGFLQEYASVRTDQESPEMSVIGQLSHRLICSPDLEALLADRPAAPGLQPR